MKITEDNLVTQLVNKNPKAADYIVETYSNLLYKIIYSVLGVYKDPQLIEECLNDVFLSSWNNINKFSKDKCKFKSWISAIAKYKAIDYKRKFSKNKELNPLDDQFEILNYSTEDEILKAERKTELIELINNMNKIDKTIFLKKYFIDESVKKIASDLNLTITNVNTRLCRGRKLLKEKLILLEERGVI